jgi:hypothetical protein
VHARIPSSSLAGGTSWCYTHAPVLLLHSLYIPNGPPPLTPQGRDLLLHGGSLVVEDALWPLLSVRFGANVTAPAFEAYLDLRTEWLQRCEPHVSVIDARAIPIRVAPFRQRYIDWLREHECALREWMIGSAYVLNSPEGHMLASLIRHGASLQTPFVVTSTMPAAAEWAAALMQDRGLGEAARRVRAHYALPTS